ncbi:Uu.00g000130.m01.CDS01 [Anthostomella pinea]|uniref:Uu.00g000130.m01.CDS01 n=1 Tax=Anthostomella pinea TaxID=933095 RepID=A0AAI8VJ65_9PEZI|nr:Uu.00g000130.m01.CDS01 [Anthostomella pinea]
MAVEDHSLLTEAKAFEQRLGSTVQAGVSFALDTVAKLDGIKAATEGIQYNTKQLFFWTSTIIISFAALFLIDQLVRLKRQLQTLNEYQATFQAFWEQDREDERLERNRRNQAANERARNRTRTPRQVAEARAAQEAQAVRERDELARQLAAPYTVEEINAALNDAPPDGTPEFYDWMDNGGPIANHIRDKMYEPPEQ